MSSLSTGLGEFINTTSPSQQPPTSPTRVFTAHVLEVVKDEKSPYYDEKLGPACIGSIKVKLIETQYNKFEDQHYYRAFPLDRGDYMLPLPGEAVICTVAQGNYTSGAGGIYIDVLYYLGVVSMEQQLTANMAPFLSSDIYHIDSGLASFVKQLSIDASLFAKRFDGRIDIDGNAFKKNIGTTKSTPGDTVLEGRFGSVIKLTSNSKDRWSTDQISNTKAGLPTDPLIIMKASRRFLANQSFDEFSSTAIDDDPNTDDTSVYITTTQNIPAILSCSERLSSWNYEQLPGSVDEGTDEGAVNLQTIYGGGFEDGAKITLNLIGSIQVKKAGT